MYEKILKGKPLGATHWQAGSYYKKDGDKWFYWDRYWFVVGDIEGLSILCMTTLK